MSTTQQHTTRSIKTGKNWNGEATILNPDEFADAVDKLDAHLTPDGESLDYGVKNPHLNGDPRYLRVTAPRKGMIYKLVDLAHDWGLVVGDVWQYDVDKSNNVLCLRLEPVEATDICEKMEQ